MLLSVGHCKFSANDLINDLIDRCVSVHFQQTVYECNMSIVVLIECAYFAYSKDCYRCILKMGTIETML